MQPPEGGQIDLGKAQVIDRVPKVIKELKFGVLYGIPFCLGAQPSGLSLNMITDWGLLFPQDE